MKIVAPVYKARDHALSTELLSISLTQPPCQLSCSFQPTFPPDELYRNSGFSRFPFDNIDQTVFYKIRQNNDLFCVFRYMSFFVATSFSAVPVDDFVDAKFSTEILRGVSQSIGADY